MQELNIGPKLRALREGRGVSLRALAEDCGMSFNTISRIERGETSPTVATLHLLAQALRVSITAFFEDHYEQSVVVVRAAARVRSVSEGIHLESLGVGLESQRTEPFEVTVQPGMGSHKSPIRHGGEEFAYCLEGRITYYIGGADYELAAGDSLLFDAVQPHKFCNLSDRVARFILVFNGLEDRHVIEHHYIEHETRR